jgi:hypothetical protein
VIYNILIIGNRMLFKITVLSSLLALSMAQIKNDKFGSASITFSGLTGRI